MCSITYVHTQTTKASLLRQCKVFIVKVIYTNFNCILAGSFSCILMCYSCLLLVFKRKLGYHKGLLSQYCYRPQILLVMLSAQMQLCNSGTKISLFQDIFNLLHRNVHVMPCANLCGSVQHLLDTLGKKKC